MQRLPGPCNGARHRLKDFAISQVRHQQAKDPRVPVPRRLLRLPNERA
ncbi:MAG: hypothetical protein QOJ99_2548 [Bryobacterales bacterium]|nr:hypothetical protein [Bryobacterales bacterium]